MAFAWAGFALNVRSMNFTVCAPERASVRMFRFACSSGNQRGLPHRPERQNAQAYGQPRLVSRYAMRPRRFSRYAGGYGLGGAPSSTQGAERKPRAHSPGMGGAASSGFRPAASDANSMGTLRSPSPERI